MTKHSSGRLQNQIAWVSGAASGIGEGVARLFAEEGVSVAVVDVSSDGARRVAEEIAESGGRATPIACDVGDEEQVRDSIEQAVAEFGGLSTLVNCAGIVHIGLLHEYSVEDWDALMKVNVKSIFLSVKHAIPHLKKQSRSYVVNIGSISSFVGQASTPAYTTSKGAVLQLSKSIALDYADIGLRCNCICPGITDTPLLRFHLNKTGDSEGALKERLRRVPMGVALSPRDIAQAARYFCCEDSSGITGTSLIIDCGYTTAAEWTSPEHTAFMDTNS